MTPLELEKLFKKHNYFDQHLGLKLSIFAPGKIRYTLTIEQAHLSSPGIAHGGLIGAMMDCVLGATALSYAVTQNQFCSTVEYKTNFLQPAKIHDQLMGEGVLEYTGNSLLVVSGSIQQVNDTKGALKIALGQGTFNLYPLDKKGIENWF